MEEKKLTDEDVVKALECCSKSWDCNNCKRNKENNNRFICSENLLKDCLDLIHRLQAENERLTEENEYLDMCGKQFLADYQKCEVERAELENQVDELKELNAKYLESIESVQAGRCRLRCILTEQAVKDTAKEILQGFMKWLNQAINESYDKSVKGSIHYGGKNRAFHEVKELVKNVAEEKGVEVE